MGKLEKLIPSLETCKALKKAGFEQDTFCFYRKSPIGQWIPTTLTSYPFQIDKCIAAPTLSELELNSDYIIKEDCGMFHGGVINIISNFEYVGGLDQFDSEIESRAALWLYLNKE
jgi:hypothetical protein